MDGQMDVKAVILTDYNNNAVIAIQYTRCGLLCNMAMA